MDRKRKRVAIGSFFQPKPKKNPDGTYTQTIIPNTAHNSHNNDRIIKCKSSKCKMMFRTMQGLGFHLNACQYYKQDLDQEKDANVCKLIVSDMEMLDASGKSVNPQVRRKAASLELDTTTNVEEGLLSHRKDGAVDGRTRNCGSSNRTTYSSDDKWKHIEQFEMWYEQTKDTNKPATVTAYITEHRLPTKFKKFLSTKHPGWREPNTKNSICIAVTDQLKQKLGVPARCRKYASKYPIMERKLVLKLKEKRARKARVSALWICTTAKKLASEDYPDSNFKASHL